MDNLNNLELLSEMEMLESTNEQKKKNDEFPFSVDMTSFWKSLVSSFERTLGELKVNGKLKRRPCHAHGV